VTVSAGLGISMKSAIGNPMSSGKRLDNKSYSRYPTVDVSVGERAPSREKYVVPLVGRLRSDD
jgi:hypothetical protein